MRACTLLLSSLSLLPAVPAHAFCGFFVAGSNDKLSNSASKVVLLRKDDHTVMTLSNNYQGPPENFALVVPVPVVLHKKDVKTLPADVFDHIDALSAPRLVEYWERDPCAPPIMYPPMAAATAVREESVRGGSGGSTGVKIEAQFVTGEYQIVILSAKDSGGLERWLHENHYHVPDGAAQALAPYVREQSKFFVAKVDITKVHRDAHGVVVLSPLRFGYPQKELRLPVRLGLLNANGPQDLIVYVLHPSSRFEAANYPNVFPPTNLEVADQVRDHFASFYAQLFDATLAKLKGRAIVTEYAWQTTSCDPCPTPPLSPSDIATLGGDLVGTQSRAMPSYMYAGWVLTRLHARYDRSTLGEDLVFREAPPIMGGRAMWNGSSEGDVEPQSSSVNNYQARYIIRHYWKGKVACANPRWGQWGGPPDGRQTVPARDLQAAPRGGMSLREVVKTKVPSLGLPGHPAPAHR